MTDRVLKTRYIDATVTTPVGTAIAAPQKVTIALGIVMLLAVRLTIPTGHHGLTGWRMDLANVTVVPYGGLTQWVIGDGEILDFTFESEVGLGLQVVTYNLGQYPHVHVARCKVQDLPDPTAGNAGTTPIVAL